ncbi:MAG: hypothetical protein IIX96_02545 [Clostridia bacterium]|nr:hypothetical protein [Clostridia bacterium]
MRVGESVTPLTPKQSLDMLQSFKRAEPIEYAAPERENKSYKIVGEAFDCYIIVEEADELLVIDKHAAHERVIFEDLKRNYEKDGRVGSQSLLLPITVMLTPDELSAAISYQSDFEALGFAYIQNGTAVDIMAIPDAISAPEAQRLFEEMTDGIVKGIGTPENTESIRREKALYQVACKAAIKGGRTYSPAVRDWLVAKLLSLPDIIVCPHGRPVAFKLKKSELDRHFDRIK